MSGFISYMVCEKLFMRSFLFVVLNTLLLSVPKTDSKNTKMVHS